MSDELVELFTNAGLSEQKAKETIKNEVVSNYFKQAIDQVKYFVHFFLKLRKSVQWCNNWQWACTWIRKEPVFDHG